MARLGDVLGSLSPDARRIHDKIAAKRGAIRGPYAALIHHPALAERVADLGEYLRFERSPTAAGGRGPRRAGTCASRRP